MSDLKKRKDELEEEFNELRGKQDEYRNGVDLIQKRLLEIRGAWHEVSRLLESKEKSEDKPKK